jgi:hypothetical protein
MGELGAAKDSLVWDATNRLLSAVEGPGMGSQSS